MTSHLHIVRPKTKADEKARLRSRSEAKVERGLRRYARAYYFRESLRTKVPWPLLFMLLIGAIMSLSLCVFAGDIRTAVGLLYCRSGQHYDSDNFRDRGCALAAVDVVQSLYLCVRGNFGRKVLPRHCRVLRVRCTG